MPSISGANEHGDGTVPVRSGRALQGKVHVCVGYRGADHEGAYKHEAQRWLTVWSITKIVQNVRDTALDYPDPPIAAAATESNA